MSPFDLDRVLADIHFLLERRDYRRCLNIIDEALKLDPKNLDLHQFAIKTAGPLGLSQRICEAFLEMAKIFEEREDVHAAAACYMEAKHFNPSIQSTQRIRKLVARVHGPKVAPEIVQAKTEEAEKTEVWSLTCDLAVLHWVDVAQVMAVKRHTGIIIVTSGETRYELAIDYGYLVGIRSPEPVGSGRDAIIKVLKTLYSLVEGKCGFLLKQEVFKDFADENIEGLLMDVAAALDEDNRDNGGADWGWGDEPVVEAPPASVPSTVGKDLGSEQGQNPFYFGDPDNPLQTENGNVLEI